MCGVVLSQVTSVFQSVYQLCGFVRCHGKVDSIRHFTTQRKTHNGKWMWFDDDHINPARFPVKKTSWYLAWYEKGTAQHVFCCANLTGAVNLPSDLSKVMPMDSYGAALLVDDGAAARAGHDHTATTSQVPLSKVTPDNGRCFVRTLLMGCKKIQQRKHMWK